MKFGVNAWVWIAPITTEGLAQVVARVAEMGFDLIEVPIEDPDAFDYARTTAVIRDHSLNASVVAAMGPDRDLIHPEKEIRDNGAAYVRHCIEAAQTLGATNVAGPLYSAVGRVWKATPEERERDMELLVQQLRGLAEYAADRGVVLCVEPLNRFETSFINLASQLVELIDRVDRPACAAMLDTFHMNIEEQSLGDAIRTVGPRLCHFHSCENDRGAPGTGHVGWSEVAAALHDIDYDGPVVIESFSAQIESIARAAAIWRPLAPSQDALAQDGLAFLRQLFA
jgi:D-psicose/D-tagatose/L-ribulose 3-epimerase